MALKKSTLEGFKNQIKWSTDKSLPFAQGYSINFVIKRYKIPAKAWGYHGSLIGVETNRQYMFWRDNGVSLDFKGLLNK